MLGQVEGLVRLVDDTGNVLGSVLQRGHAEARGHLERLLGLQLLADRLGDSGSRLLGYLDRLIELRAGHQNAELLATVTADEIGLSEVRDQKLCNGLDHLISHHVTKLVVDGLEPINVGHDAGERLALGNRLGPGEIRLLEERAAIQTARKRVLGSESLQLGIL